MGAARKMAPEYRAKLDKDNAWRREYRNRKRAEARTKADLAIATTAPGNGAAHVLLGNPDVDVRCEGNRMILTLSIPITEYARALGLVKQ